MVLALARKIANRFSVRSIGPMKHAIVNLAVGLGLAIVETAIQQHRGWVKEKRQPAGRFTAGDLVAAVIRVKLPFVGRIRRLRRIRI